MKQEKKQLKIEKREKKRSIKEFGQREKRLEHLLNGNLIKKGKAGLCLGGGGARGFAHLGALRAFEEAGLDFDIVVGTSVGSIVGALYSYGVSSEKMYEFGRELNAKDIHNGNILFPNDALKIGKIITDFIGDVQFSDLKKQFCAVAVDLISAKEVLLDSGSVALACSASSCVPLFFKPVVTDDGKHLVDGGVLNNIPADVCRMLGANNVVTIDVNPTRGSGSDKLGLIGVAKTVFSIMSANASFNGLINSDIIIGTDTTEFSSSSFEGYDEMYKRGYDSAKAQIYEISKLLYF